MVELFGAELSREELKRLLGDFSQLAGVRPVQLADGPERGVRAFQFWTGSGLEFTVLADRGWTSVPHATGAFRWPGVLP